MTITIQSFVDKDNLLESYFPQLKSSTLFQNNSLFMSSISEQINSSCISDVTELFRISHIDSTGKSEKPFHDNSLNRYIFVPTHFQRLIKMYCDLKPFENNQKARRFLKHLLYLRYNIPNFPFTIQNLLMAEKKNLHWQKQPKFFYKSQATPFHSKVSKWF
jgi:hypothetical protein